MISRHCHLALAVFALINGSTHAALSKNDLARIEQWLKQPVEERVPISALGLDGPLDAHDTDEVALQIRNQLRVASPADESPLGALPAVGADPKPGVPVQVPGGVLELGEYRMPFAIVRREAHPIKEGQRPLFICLHGGGQNADSEGPHTWPVNSSEFQAQISLALQVYPADGIFWIPRMADDRLGRWWHAFNQQAFDQVIDHAILHWGVDPNRVYLLGISEGGYGTDILGPFMADRWAGCAAMAAGVGLDNPPENLRHVAFRTDVGELDTMFDRCGLAKEFHQQLDKLKATDTTGYRHLLNVQAGRGHGIDYGPGPQWIAEHTRTALPNRVTWIDKPLDNQRRSRFYWLMPEVSKRPDRLLWEATANRTTNRITIDAQQQITEGQVGHPTHLGPPVVADKRPLVNHQLTLLLSDGLVDLDRPIEVIVGNRTISIKPRRTAAALLESLLECPDLTTAASCRASIVLP